MAYPLSETERKALLFSPYAGSFGRFHGYTVELLGEFEQSYFVAYDLLFVGHLTSFLAICGNFNEMSD